MENIASNFQWHWPIDISDAAKQIDHFLDPKMLHQDAAKNLTIEENPGLSSWVVSTYNALLLASHSEESEMIEVLTNVHEELKKEMHSPLGKMLLENSEIQTCRLFEIERNVTHAKKKLAQRNKQLAQAKAQLTQRNEQLAQAKAQLTQRNEQLAQAKAQLTQRNEQLTQRNEQLAQAKAQLTQRNEQLADILNSRFWKLIKLLKKCCHLGTNKK